VIAGTFTTSDPAGEGLKIVVPASPEERSGVLIELVLYLRLAMAAWSICAAPDPERSAGRGGGDRDILFPLPCSVNRCGEADTALSPLTWSLKGAAPELPPPMLLGGALLILFIYAL